MYIDEITKETRVLDKKFTSEKGFGKLLIEVNYFNGKYVSDNVTSVIQNKRLEKCRIN